MILGVSTYYVKCVHLDDLKMHFTREFDVTEILLNGNKTGNAGYLIQTSGFSEATYCTEKK